MLPSSAFGLIVPPTTGRKIVVPGPPGCVAGAIGWIPATPVVPVRGTVDTMAEGQLHRDRIGTRLADGGAGLGREAPVVLAVPPSTSTVSGCSENETLPALP